MLDFQIHTHTDSYHNNFQDTTYSLKIYSLSFIRYFHKFCTKFYYKETHPGIVMSAPEELVVEELDDFEEDEGEESEGEDFSCEVHSDEEEETQVAEQEVNYSLNMV